MPLQSSVREKWKTGSGYERNRAIFRRGRQPYASPQDTDTRLGAQGHYRVHAAWEKGYEAALQADLQLSDQELRDKSEERVHLFSPPYFSGSEIRQVLEAKLAALPGSRKKRMAPLQRELQCLKNEHATYMSMVEFVDSCGVKQKLPLGVAEHIASLASRTKLPDAPLKPATIYPLGIRTPADRSDGSNLRREQNSAIAGYWRGCTQQNKGEYLERYLARIRQNGEQTSD